MGSAEVEDMVGTDGGCGWGEGQERGGKENKNKKTRLILGGIDERKGITGFGREARERPGAGLVYVDD